MINSGQSFLENSHDESKLELQKFGVHDYYWVNDWNYGFLLSKITVGAWKEA